MIKISKWEDLNKLKNEKYLISVGEGCGYISIHNLATSILSIQYGNEVDKNITLAWLKLFGFNVEFKEPKKISERLYHLCKAYPNWWIAADEDKGYGLTFLYLTKPVRADGGWVGNCLQMVEIENPLTWEDEPVNTNDMAKWEVDDE